MIKKQVFFIKIESKNKFTPRIVADIFEEGLESFKHKKIDFDVIRAVEIKEKIKK